MPRNDPGHVPDAQALPSPRSGAASQGSSARAASRRTLPIVSIVLILLLVFGAAPAGRAATEGDGTPVCHACGLPIEGSFITAQGGTYHPEHFLCARCGRPLTGRFVVQNGENYHPECWEDGVALRCAICGGTLAGRYLKDAWGNAYHAEHERESAQCEYCRRLVAKATTGGGVRYGDGRVVCNLCRRRALDEPEAAEALMREVARRLDAAGIDVPLDGIRLHLVDLEELKSLVGGGSDLLRGWTLFESQRRFGGRGRQRADMHILHGMPVEDATAALAHELMHVWESRRGRLHNDEAFSEGSCNYAAWLVLKDDRSEQARFILRAMADSPHRVYGEGFRRVKRYAEQRGRAAWLQRFAAQDRLPPGY